jgi:hypothetical protein
MLREFIYVDVQRARSLLAQLDRGVVEQTVQRRSSDDAGELGINILGFGAKGAWTARSDVEEARSLQDLTFTVFEEAIEDSGLLIDMADHEVDDPTAWRGDIHEILAEGQLVRIRSDVLVVDPNFIRSRFDGLTSFMDDLVSMQQQVAEQAIAAAMGPALNELRQQTTSSSLNAQQRKTARRQLEEAEALMRDQAAAAAVEEIGGEAGLQQMTAVMRVVTSFLGDEISMRVVPCGIELPELGFAGSLLGRDDYLQKERADLFSRYGSILRGWTTVLQIAQIPSEESTAAAVELDPEVIAQITSGQAVSRAGFERAAVGLLGSMEALGLAEGPRWPTISAVPLAIYRVVPGSDKRSGLD